MMQCEKPQAYVVSTTSDAIVKTNWPLKKSGKGRIKNSFSMLFLGMTKRQSSSPTVRMIWERPWNQFSPFWMKKERQLTSTSLPQFWIYNPQKECRRKEGQQPQKSLASEAQSGEQCRLWILKHWVNSQILGQRSWWVVSFVWTPAISNYFVIFYNVYLHIITTLAAFHWGLS